MPVVVGAVPTREGRAAVRHAAGLAVERGTCLVVVTSGRGEQDEQLRGAIADAGAVVAAQGLEVRRVDGAGDVADDLVAAANDHAAHCIVVGLRRRSPIGKLVLGSNVQRILLEARCPVLAVKPGPRD